MRSFTAWSIRSSAALLLLVVGTPARASHWDRIEIIGVFAGNGFAGLRVFDYGIYNAR